MKSSKGISVIIPTFNRAKFLYPTLICLCNQKDLPCEYEIIIVDSGDDETEKLVNTFKKSINTRIIYKKIRKCKNRSLLRNKGAALATKEILCFLDNDMLVPQNFIKTHYEEHQQVDELVLMGCRRFLTEFDLEQLGSQTLINNFALLEQLPWYRDERLTIYDERYPWRFCYSNTLSLRKRIFNKAGKFDKRFGEHWGYEDIELGYRLYKQNYNFKLLTTLFSYHQPHVIQSLNEQSLSSYNKNLFLKFHNSIELEIYSAFYDAYYKYYEEIKSIHFKDELSLFQKLSFKNIYGCTNPQIYNKKFTLGVYTLRFHFDKKALIINSFFEISSILQLAILRESFKRHKYIYFYKISTAQKNSVIALAQSNGNIVSFFDKNDYTVFYIQRKVNNNFYNCILPEVYSSEKRFVYTWLCKELIKNKNYLRLEDIYKSSSLKNNDLRLLDEDVDLLDSKFKISYGNARFQNILSYSMLIYETGIKVNDYTNSIVIDDEEYESENRNILLLKNKCCRVISKQLFAEITFLAAFSFYTDYKQKEAPIKNSIFVSFMENGFYEDGIDLLLNAFVSSIKSETDTMLVIKLPCINELQEHIFPEHNKQSKFNKTFAFNQKWEREVNLLLNMIHEKALESKVKIIRENYTVKKIIDLIKGSSKILYFGRGCYIPYECYFGVLLNKDLIIGEHHIIPDFLNDYVCKIRSKRFSFADEIRIPKTLLNVSYAAYRIDSEDLAKAFSLTNLRKQVCFDNEVGLMYHRIRNVFVED